MVIRRGDAEEEEEGGKMAISMGELLAEDIEDKKEDNEDHEKQERGRERFRKEGWVSED